MWTPVTTVDELVARIETGDFDFKTEYDLAANDTKSEIAKDVAAFATAYGGTIVVGARHVAAKGVVQLLSVPDAQRLATKLADALQEYCVPIPPTPALHVLTVSPADAIRILAPGCAAPSGDVTLVAINVDADPRGPIGARACVNGQPQKHTYRFPIRVSEKTDFLNPSQLAMWMNSNERRVALQLRKVLASTAGVPPLVRVHSRMGAMLQQPTSRDYDLIAVDERASHVVLRWRPENNPHAVVNVPLSFVTAVWQDAKEQRWEMAVVGGVFAAELNGVLSTFRPYMGG